MTEFDNTDVTDASDEFDIVAFYEACNDNDADSDDLGNNGLDIGDPDLVPITETELFGAAVKGTLTPLIPMPPTPLENVADTEAGREANPLPADQISDDTAPAEHEDSDESNGAEPDGKSEGEEEEPDDPLLMEIFEETFFVPAWMYEHNVAELDMKAMTRRVWKGIARLNEKSPARPLIFRYNGEICRLVRDDEGRLFIQLMSRDHVRNFLGEHFEFFKVVKGTDEMDRSKVYPQLPPNWLCANLLATPEPSLPIVEGIIEAPMIAANGILQNKRGYSLDTRQFLEPSNGLEVPPVPARPTGTEIEGAVRLIKEAFQDFPFVSAGEFATTVCLLLQRFVRPLIDGPTPLHLVEKPTPGTGASLLVDVMTLVTQGRTAPVQSLPATNEEIKKTITAVLLGGDPIVLFDNVRRTVDADALAAVLTSQWWAGRMLGKTRMLHLKVGCAFVITANNANLSREIARRTVRIRMDAKMDNPEKRPPESFLHADLRMWVKEKRGELIWAALVLSQAWIAAGRPAAPHGRSLGSYESWSRVMGGILHVAGIDGFLTNLDDLDQSANTETAPLRALVEAWKAKFAHDAVKVSDLYPLALESEPAIDLGNANERGQKIKLGILIGSLRDRQFDDVRIVADGAARNALKWRLQPVDTEE